MEPRRVRDSISCIASRAARAGIIPARFASTARQMALPTDE